MIAMEIMHKFGWNYLWLETDSSYVVLLVKKNSYRVPWKFRNRWIRDLQYAKNLNAHVSHIFHEGNRVVDKLASMSIDVNLNNWWF